MTKQETKLYVPPPQVKAVYTAGDNTILVETTNGLYVVDAATGHAHKVTFE